MKLLRSTFTWSCVVLIAATAFGHTYPDGSVSTFDPGFFGVGITEPAVASYVFGVGAQGGKFNGAVGQINGKEGAATQQPALFNGGNSFFPLPRLNNAPNGGTSVGISDDGKIKVGFGPGAVYWDANNEIHALPSDRQSALASAITPDGTWIAGEILTEVHDDGLVINEACKWRPNGSAPLRLGIPIGFQSSIAYSISEGGEAVAGDASYFDGSTSPPTNKIRPFISISGQARLLESVGDTDTFAFGISDDSGPRWVVGQGGPLGAMQALMWIAASPPADSSQFFVLEGLGHNSGARAIRVLCKSPSGLEGRIVGENTDEVGATAFMWNLTRRPEGTIAGILQNRYKKSVGLWQLTLAYALSGDGYTVGGIG
ncbi:MAG TPA: hypothetical protein VH252_06000, partial [Chthoniobacterales bacterium]|nr:hypothetical protein [Chthoniobacterales bacterium]